MATLLLCPLARAQEDEARQRYDLGVRLFKEDRFAEAAAAFREAYRLMPSWKVLFTLGQTEAAAKQYDFALEHFEAYLAEGGDEVPVDRRDAVTAELQQLRGLVGVLEITGGEGALLLIDGEPRATLPVDGPVRVSVGKRTVTVVRLEQTLLAKEVRVVSGLVTQLEVPAEAPSPPAPPAPSAVDVDVGPVSPPVAVEMAGPSKLRVAAWWSVGAGAALLVAGGIVGGVALARDAACPNGACPTRAAYEDARSVRELGIASNVLLVSGGVVAVTGLSLLVMDVVRERHTNGMSFALSWSRSGPGVVFERRF